VIAGAEVGEKRYDWFSHDANRSERGRLPLS